MNKPDRRKRQRHEPNIKDYHREYHKKWTPEENETIAKMRADGHTYYEIGLVVGCPENNVRSHWTHIMKAEREKEMQKGVDTP